MTVVFAGGELDAFTINGTTPFESTNSARFDPTFARRALRPIATANMQADFSAPLTEGWLHLNVNYQSIRSTLQDQSFILLQDVGAGVTGMQIDADNGVFNLEYWNGSGFTELSPNLNMSNDVTGGNRIDMHWRIADTNGIFEVYVDGRFITSFEGDTLNGFTQFDRAIIRSPSTNNSDVQTAYYSEIIIADVETIGWHLATLEPSGDGNSTTWIGDFNDVNAGSLDDGTFVLSGIIEEVEQFTIANLGTAFEVKALTIAARSRNVIDQPDFANVILLINNGTGTEGNQDMIDESLLAWTISWQGAAQMDTGIVKFVGSPTLLLDGQSDGINVGSTFVTLGTNDFTIEAWVRPDGTPTNTIQIIMGKWSGVTSRRGWRAYRDGNDKFVFVATQDGSTTILAMTSTLTIDQDVWTWVVIQREGDDFTMWIDGVRDATASNTLSIHNGGSSELRMGQRSTSVDEFKGNFGPTRVSLEAVFVGAPATIPVPGTVYGTGAGGQNLQMSVRTGGSDFFSSNVAISSSFATGQTIFDQNPDTAADWTTSEIDAVEIGLKSKP